MREQWILMTYFSTPLFSFIAIRTMFFENEQKFKYLLVDEFQDTNFLQYAILKKLDSNIPIASTTCALWVMTRRVFTPFVAQTIENILDFSKDFPQLQTFKLEQNYRSGQYIVNAANNVMTIITANQKRNMDFSATS